MEFKTQEELEQEKIPKDKYGRPFEWHKVMPPSKRRPSKPQKKVLKKLLATPY
jgi:hypothetical protein